MLNLPDDNYQHLRSDQYRAVQMDLPQLLQRKLKKDFVKWWYAQYKLGATEALVKFVNHDARKKKTAADY